MMDDLDHMISGTPSSAALGGAANNAGADLATCASGDACFAGIIHQVY
jgi:hypothetical protein